MTIYIVRHGETDGNFGGVIQFPDTPLNPRGLAQADAVAARLADAGIRRILASDYARAHTTAEAIGRRAGAPLEIHAGLRERNFGDLRGRPRAEIGDRMYADDFEPPNGESWPVFHDRVTRTWADVVHAAAQTEGDIAIVTHGLVCYSLVLRQLRLPDGIEPVRGFGNTSVTVVEGRAPWAVTLLNCIAHLDRAIDARGSVT
jgi:broad specificity phosphatase PhoE